MKKIKKFQLFFFEFLKQRLPYLYLFLVLNFLLQNTSFAENEDSQIWTETWIYLPQIKTNYSFGYINVSRFGRDASTLVDERQSIFATKHFSKEFNVSLMHSFIEQDPTPPENNLQHRTTMDLHGAFQTENFNFPYRLRAERQIRESQDDKWNFRPRFGVELLNTFKESSTKPFFNIEGFYDSVPREWYRARILSGLIFKLCNEINLDVYLGRQLNRNTNNDDLTIGGLTLKYFF